MNGRPQGWYHLGHGRRVYSPLLMRFHCPDSLSPFGAGGVNAYAYCQGDPLNFTDPTGHAPEDLTAMVYLLHSLAIGLGMVTLVLPHFLRRGPPGGLRARYAATKPNAATPVRGVEAYTTGIGMAGAAVGIAATAIAADDPQNGVAVQLMHVTLGLSSALIGVKAAVYVAPKIKLSGAGQKVARFIHGRKTIQEAMDTPLSSPRQGSPFDQSPDVIPMQQMVEIRSPSIAVQTMPPSPDSRPVVFRTWRDRPEEKWWAFVKGPHRLI